MREIANSCGSFIVDDSGALLDFKCAEENFYKPLSGPYVRDEKHVMWLTIPEGVTALPAGAFDGYDVFMEIAFPQSLRRIGDESGGALRFCSLRDVELPEKLEALAPGSFLGSSISLIRLPDGMDVRLIQECIYQFKSYTSHSYLFYPVEKVRDLPPPVHAEKELKNECGSFFVDECGCLARFVCAPENNAAGCSPEETKDVYNLRIPEGVATLPYNAFMGYTVRLLLTLPDSLLILGTGNGCAFQGGTYPEVHIPAGLKILGTFAFGCSRIRDLWFPREMMDWGYARHFKGARIGTLHIPAGLEYDRYLHVLFPSNNVTVDAIVQDAEPEQN